MPYTKRKVPRKDCYRVTNTIKKRVFSKCATKENAMKQMRLLRALQFNKNFKPNSSKNRTRRRGK